MFATNEIDLLRNWIIISDAEVVMLKKRIIEEVAKCNLTLNNIKVAVETFPQNGELEEIQLTIHDENPYKIKIACPSGCISAIRRLVKEDHEQIKSENEIKPLPLQIDDMILDYDETPIIKINNEIFPLKIYYKNNEIDNHFNYIPLCKSDVDIMDFGARLTGYDKEGIYGLLLSRFSWGHNPYVGLLDVKNRKINLIKGGHNYDYPEIICFKIQEDNKSVDAYLLSGEEDYETIYENDNYEQAVTIDNFYGASKWQKIL